MKIKLFPFIFACVLFVSSSSIYAQTSPAKRVNDLLSQINTYTAHFEQTTRTERGKVQQRSAGKVWIARPGYFRWETNEPTHQIIIANGKTLWIYDVSLSQISKHPINNRSMINPAMLLSGSVRDLTRNFRIQRIPSSTGEHYLLRLKYQGGTFQWVELAFNNNQLIGMRVGNNLGQITQYLFSDIQMNQILTRDIFQMQTPPGVDVLTQ